MINAVKQNYEKQQIGFKGRSIIMTGSEKIADQIYPQVLRIVESGCKGVIDKENWKLSKNTLGDIFFVQGKDYAELENAQKSLLASDNDTYLNSLPERLAKVMRDFFGENKVIINTQKPIEEQMFVNFDEKKGAFLSTIA